MGWWWLVLEEAREDGGRQRPGDQPSCTFPARKRDSKAKASERPWDKEEVREKLRKRRQETRSALSSFILTSPKTHQAQVSSLGHITSHQSGAGGLISPEQLLDVLGEGGGSADVGLGSNPINPWGRWAVGPHSATRPDSDTVPASQQGGTTRGNGGDSTSLAPGACPIRKAATQAPEAHSAPSL